MPLPPRLTPARTCSSLLRRVALLAVPAALLVPLLAGPAASPATAAGTDAPPAQSLTAISALPPGNSGFVNAAGQARGQSSGRPGDYGPHLDDQRRMYWEGKYKQAGFAAPTGTPVTPRDGVRIYRDAFGVPQVYGDTGFDVWFGAGYAAGQDRLFLADAVRRMGRGTFAELVGPSGVPVDVQARVLTYSSADYTRMFAALPRASQDAIRGYAEGLNAWIARVNSDPTGQTLPAEYGLLSSRPEPWTVEDTLAAGVLITRTVASAGGTEPGELDTLRTLQTALGSKAGRAAYQNDVKWLQDAKAATTVPAASGLFRNRPTEDPRTLQRAFDTSVAYAYRVPRELATGPGTGAFPVPGSSSSSGAAASTPRSVAAAGVVAGAVEALNAYRAGLRGGSYMIAVSGKRSATGKPLLLSGPQLGYTYPSLLWELEVHGGGYDARGSSVPSLPTVGIGYGKSIAWGVTTGNSKTRDSFVETTRRTPAGALEYFHRGVWRSADCRSETVRYRQAPNGVPAGPPAQSVTVEVCRTVHGPVISSTADGTRAVSSQLAMYGRELETVNGILQWNRARNFAEFEAGVRMVTWNENVTYAGSDGRIGFWHPGLFPLRHPLADPRFVQPGDGSRDWQRLLTFAEMPKSIDPAQGFLTNWNNKPAIGWTDTYLDPASGRPSGAATRHQALSGLISRDSSITYDDLQRIDFRLGVIDHRASTFLPLVRRLLAAGPLTASQRRVATVLASWDGTAYGPGAGTSPGELEDTTVTDGPAPTAFAVLMDALRDVVLTESGGLPRSVVLQADTVENHLFDSTAADNLVLRVLDPGQSALRTSRDYTRGRGARSVLLSAVDRATTRLEKQYGSADPSRWRRQHPRKPIKSLTGVIGPSSNMPFEDRGSWIHVVDLSGPGKEPRALRVPRAWS